MTHLITLIDPSSEVFLANVAHNRALAQELSAKNAIASFSGRPGARERQVARDKLLPRNRVHRLLDPGSPYLEVGALAATGLYSGEAPGAGVIDGIGRVSDAQYACKTTDQRGAVERLKLP
jgi:3-methylcrotonyl-CoA carboxylase beta subunit